MFFIHFYTIAYSFLKSIGKWPLKKINVSHSYTKNYIIHSILQLQKIYILLGGNIFPR